MDKILNNRRGEKENIKVIEEWKEIEKFPKYKINRKGVVIKIENNRKIKTSNVLGYCSVMLDDGGERAKTRYIHRLLMETFNPVRNMENMIVDHIDGNRKNCNLENLRWVTKHSNALFRKENQIEVYTIVQECIEKFGYQRVIEHLEKMNV